MTVGVVLGPAHRVVLERDAAGRDLGVDLGVGVAVHVRERDPVGPRPGGLEGVHDRVAARPDLAVDEDRGAGRGGRAADRLEPPRLRRADPVVRGAALDRTGAGRVRREGGVVPVGRVHADGQVGDDPVGERLDRRVVDPVAGRVVSVAVVAGRARRSGRPWPRAIARSPAGSRPSPIGVISTIDPIPLARPSATSSIAGPGPSSRRPGAPGRRRAGARARRRCRAPPPRRVPGP